MNKMSRMKWQELENAFLAGDLDEESFCKSRNLDLSWFREELSKSESHDGTMKKGESAPLFVELLASEESVPESRKDGYLKLKFREVELEYGNGVGESTLREVLRAIREEL